MATTRSAPVIALAVLGCVMMLALRETGDPVEPAPPSRTNGSAPVRADAALAAPSAQALEPERHAAVRPNPIPEPQEAHGWPGAWGEASVAVPGTRWMLGPTAYVRDFEFAPAR